jgi:hypothetical protein
MAILACNKARIEWGKERIENGPDGFLCLGTTIRSGRLHWIRGIGAIQCPYESYSEFEVAMISGDVYPEKNISFVDYLNPLTLEEEIEESNSPLTSRKYRFSGYRGFSPEFFVWLRDTKNSGFRITKGSCGHSGNDIEIEIVLLPSKKVWALISSYNSNDWTLEGILSDGSAEVSCSAKFVKVEAEGLREATFAECAEFLALDL